MEVWFTARNETSGWCTGFSTHVEKVADYMGRMVEIAAQRYGTLCTGDYEVGVSLISGTMPAMPTVSLGAMEDREKGAPRSSMYKGEVVLHEENKLTMKDSNRQAMELHLGQDS